MARHDCDICGGSGEIRVPVRPKLRVVDGPNLTADVALPALWRSYACPECSDTVALRNLGVLYECAHVDERYQIPEDRIKEQLAHEMVANILRHDLIEFRRGAPIRAQMEWAMTGTLLIAPRKTASNFEDYAKDRATAITRQVVDVAGHEINNWGSYFGHSEILKQDAIRLMGSAMRDVFKRLDMVKSA